ncbi:unnamed protein product [Orchesella dallaii]|uniref:GTP-binding protein Di-Ras2 n=1 Tax=Orchesella dallaii TaxID=48710 RepID=A0ABP1S2H3_9HEXA
MVDSTDRTRLVLLGGPGVGKSAIVKRFLFNQYPEKHKPTVEDSYSHEFNVDSSIPLKVDILDTAGDFQFPAMRRLSIANAHAFRIVYAIDSKVSFEQVKGCFEEIREQRSDFQEVPIIIAGNKADIGMNKREVEFDEVCDWIHDYLPKLRGKAMECSAKENRNVREIFKAFLTLSKIPFRNAEDTGGILKTGTNINLRRRSSAYAGSKNRNLGSLKGKDQQQQQESQSSTPASSNRSRFGFLNARGASEGSATIPDEENNGKTLSTNLSKTQSLIRRCSRKAKQQARDANGGPGDCQVS